MDQIVCVDTQLVKVPFEALKRQARERKAVIERLKQTLAQVTAATNDASVSQEAAANMLGSVAASLRAELGQHDAASAAEAGAIDRCAARLRFLRECGDVDNGSIIKYNSKRLPFLLIDYLLREGYFETASALTQQYDCESLCDWRVFRSAESVIKSLRAQSCDLALSWCEENAVRLQRVKSRLVFRLRLQEYIELIKRDAIPEALKYAQEKLSPFAHDDFAEFKAAIALLVFRKDTSCPRFQAVLSADRWQALVGLFVQDLLQINGMTPISLLELQLQAGLTALKCPLSFEEGCTKEDPLHLPQVRELAAGLPTIKNRKSRLICAISKAIMDDSNPPMVLPNGFVYSRNALRDMAAKADGKVVCPMSGKQYLYEQCNVAYIM